MIKLELGKWDDGKIMLAFWDSIHGDDGLFHLNPDGTVRLLEVHGKGEVVNLALELIKLLEKRSEAA